MKLLRKKDQDEIVKCVIQLTIEMLKATEGNEKAHDILAQCTADIIQLTVGIEGHVQMMDALLEQAKLMMLIYAEENKDRPE